MCGRVSVLEGGMCEVGCVCERWCVCVRGRVCVVVCVFWRMVCVSETDREKERPTDRELNTKGNG